MKIIKSVECIEVPNDYGTVYRYVNNNPKLAAGLVDPKNFHVEEETIYGRFFRTTDGKGVVIGMTKAVEDEIGLIMDSFRTQQKKLDTAENSLFEYTIAYGKLYSEIKTLSFWQRVKMVFKVDVLKLNKYNGGNFNLW